MFRNAAHGLLGGNPYLYGQPVDMPAELQLRSTQQCIEEHREQWLLAFAWCHLRDNDLLGAQAEAEKFLLLASLNLVECIALAGAQARPAPPST